MNIVLVFILLPIILALVRTAILWMNPNKLTALTRWEYGKMMPHFILFGVGGLVLAGWVIGFLRGDIDILTLSYMHTMTLWFLYAWIVVTFAPRIFIKNLKIDAREDF